MKRAELGVAVIGSGRIGTLRAKLAAKHPSVGFLAISDLAESRARALAEETGADVYSGDNFAMIERPEVNAVFVSTPEGEHATNHSCARAGKTGARREADRARSP